MPRLSPLTRTRQVLTKSSPDEKIGALCRKAGKFAVVEYSDIDEVNKNKRCARCCMREQSLQHIADHIGGVSCVGRAQQP